jgi:ribosomal protein S18 acetylase RimI-like enzyme
MERPLVRVAARSDADAIGRMLHDFNAEFGDPAPPPAELAQRVRFLMDGGDTVIVVGGAGPDAVAVLRLRAALWMQGLECYLAELYVAPACRGRGLGRAVMEFSIELARERGASYMDLGTAESDAVAIALYESLGFSCREGKPDGPVNRYYERDL